MTKVFLRCVDETDRDGLGWVYSHSFEAARSCAGFLSDRHLHRLEEHYGIANRT